MVSSSARPSDGGTADLALDSSQTTSSWAAHATSTHLNRPSSTPAPSNSPPGPSLLTELDQHVGDRPVYFHLDCDVLEPGTVPTDYRVANGLTLDDLTAVSRRLSQNQIVGIEIAEFEAAADPTDDTNYAQPLVEALAPLVTSLHPDGTRGADGPRLPDPPHRTDPRAAIREEPEVSRVIAAPADVLYAMVSDLSRMGEWSPENVGGRWRRGSGPTVGGRFKGRNERGLARWTTNVEVTAAEPGRLFEFVVHLVWPLTYLVTWGYRFEPQSGSTLVTQYRQDHRPTWWVWVGSKQLLRTPPADQASTDPVARLRRPTRGEAHPDGGRTTRGRERPAACRPTCRSIENRVR